VHQIITLAAVVELEEMEEMELLQQEELEELVKIMGLFLELHLEKVVGLLLVEVVVLVPMEQVVQVLHLPEVVVQEQTL
jgi:hypothetical protein